MYKFCENWEEIYKFCGNRGNAICIIGLGGMDTSDSLTQFLPCHTDSKEAGLQLCNVTPQAVCSPVYNYTYVAGLEKKQT